MSSRYTPYEVEGIGALAVEAAVPDSRYHAREVSSVSLKLSAAPTTDEDYTITLDSAAGSVSDVVLYRVNPADNGNTEITWLPEAPVVLRSGDALDLAYANTDLATWAVRVLWKEVY